MNNIDSSEILRCFEENRQLVVSGQDKRWRWRTGTFLFPEGRCCYCRAAVRSNRIWVAEPGWLKGQLRLDGIFAVWEPPNHPHAGTDGGLCLGGTTDDLTTILFFGVNPADTIRWHGTARATEAAAGIRAWYAEMFGHECGGAGVLKASEIFASTTPMRRDRQPSCPCGCGCNPENGECDCGCDDCYCDYFECDECGERTHVDERYSSMDGGDYCNHCWHRKYRECDYCGQEMRMADGIAIETNEGTWCPEHATLEDRRPQGLVVEAMPAPAPAGIDLEAMLANIIAQATARDREVEMQRTREQIEALRTHRPRLPADIVDGDPPF